MHSHFHTCMYAHSQTAKGRHYRGITHFAMTVNGLALPIQHEVRPDSRPSLTLPVIYVAPGTRVYSRAQRGMKVLTVSVGEGGC